MLLKNFGVTRHGRVVFYDYDEISFLTEVNFRHIPPPRYPEDEMASEPGIRWGRMTSFPRNFRAFCSPISASVDSSPACTGSSTTPITGKGCRMPSAGAR